MQLVKLHELISNYTFVQKADFVIKLTLLDFRRFLEILFIPIYLDGEQRSQVPAPIALFLLFVERLVLDFQ